MKCGGHAKTGLARRRVLERVLRAMTLLGFAFGACGLLGASGCSGATGGYTCEGQISTECADLNGDLCAKAKGCHATPGNCVHLCEAPGTNCETSGCFASATGCQARCAGDMDETSCTAEMASLGGGSAPVQICNWGADGCTSPCASLKSNGDCAAQRVKGCIWLGCDGTPQGPCSSYSGNDCPTFLGCDRVAHPLYSAQ